MIYVDTCIENVRPIIGNMSLSVVLDQSAFRGQILDPYCYDFLDFFLIIDREFIVANQMRRYTNTTENKLNCSDNEFDTQNVWVHYIQGDGMRNVRVQNWEESVGDWNVGYESHRDMERKVWPQQPKKNDNNLQFYNISSVYAHSFCVYMWHDLSQTYINGILLLLFSSKHYFFVFPLLLTHSVQSALSSPQNIT